MAKVINGCNQLHFYDPGNSISRPPPSWVSSSRSGKDYPFFILISHNGASSLPVFCFDHLKYDLFITCFFLLTTPNMTFSWPVFCFDHLKYDFFITCSMFWPPQIWLLHDLFFVLTTSNMTSSLPLFWIDQPKYDFFITWPLFRVTEAWKVIMWVVSPWRRVKRQFLISAPSYTQTTRHKTSWKARRMKISREIVTSR